MPSETERSHTRGEMILDAAINALGRHGVRGSSLRDIAREAHVSLTLINHHFGDKPKLVGAAIAASRSAAEKSLHELATSLTSAPPDIDVLAAAWVRHQMLTYGRKVAHRHLRLMLRLQSDPEVDSEIRLSIDPARPIVIAALTRIFRNASESDIALAWTAASSALHASLMERADLAEQPLAQASLTRFLRAGLLEALINSSTESNSPNFGFNHSESNG